jgi:prepilin-type N-terminal cleavage/methylation domain-containing protein
VQCSTVKGFNTPMFNDRLNKICVKGFTLSELLISLSVLGLISAIVMPILFQSIEKGKRTAIFKESIQVFNKAFMQCMEDYTCKDGDIRPMLAKINTVKQCTPANESECRTISTVEDNEHGLILASGAYAWGFRSPFPAPDDWFYIDYNGTAPPNVVGEDIIYMVKCFDPYENGGLCNPALIENPVNGKVDVARVDAPSVALYNKLYKGG